MTATLTRPAAYEADIAALAAAGIPATYDYFGHGWNVISVELTEDRRLLIGSSGDDQMCLPLNRDELAGWRVSHVNGDGDFIDEWSTGNADTASLVAICARVHGNIV